MATTSYATVAAAVAEINRLLPVYDAACRLADDLAYHGAVSAAAGAADTFTGKLLTAIGTARPTRPDSTTGFIQPTSPTAVDGS